MATRSELYASPPRALQTARALAHKSVQILTRAARANLAAASDDSHSNLEWRRSRQQFLSHPLLSGDRNILAGLSLSPLQLDVVCDGTAIASLGLEGQTFGQASAWLDDRLDQLGLRSTSDVALPYDLPDDAAAIDRFETAEHSEQLASLATWFTLADHILSDFALSEGHIVPGPSPVRCWPHHFDIATYVQLERGDFEAARGIGVGMSPGDSTYDLPYFYINPWPHLAVDGLPTLPAPGHWHLEGFVGAIATADEIASLTDITSELPDFIETAFFIGREQLGA